jgi:pimeloyl-ACP methyl ester carboxylesterase
MNLPIKTTAWMRPANLIHNVILVHGAWADGSSWDKVIPLLEEKGFHVTAVHLPFTALAEDPATVERALALQDGPVLLVGHSYGGAVITEADVEGGGVGVCGLFRHWAGCAFGSSAIDGSIQSTKARDSLIDQAAHIFLVTHVGAHEFGLCA